jgi:hypothetical protein
MTEHRIFGTPFAVVYPLYLAKLIRKGHTEEELRVVTRWLTGFTDAEIDEHLARESTFADFFATAKLHDNASHITGVICGMRVENIEDPLMQKIRYLDKLVDEVGNGKKMTSILRGSN